MGALGKVLDTSLKLVRAVCYLASRALPPESLKLLRAACYLASHALPPIEPELNYLDALSH